MTDDERLDAIEKREKAATPGEWKIRPRYEVNEAGTFDWDDLYCDTCEIGTIDSSDDAEFVAACRQDIPWLVSQLRQAREAMEASLRMLEFDYREILELGHLNKCWERGLALTIEQLRAALSAGDKAQDDATKP